MKYQAIKFRGLFSSRLLLLCFFLFIGCLGYSQVLLFNNTLQPTTPELIKELAQYTAPSPALEVKTEELRKIAYLSGAAPTAKIDLASFILRQLLLRHERPYEENEDLMFEAVDLLPGNFFVEVMWGDLLYFKGDYNKAMEHYEAALFQKPDDEQLISKIAVIALLQMQYEKATPLFEKLLTSKPQDFLLLYSLGRCHYELKHFEEAIDCWERALTLTNDEREKQAIKNSLNSAREMMASTDDSTREENQRFVIHFAGDSQQDIGDITSDALEDIYFQVTDSLNFSPDVKINVVFFLTEDYYKVSREWSAASAQGIQIMVPLKSGYKTPDYVKGLLAHEFTHTIIHLKTNNRCPLWLNEGIAQYQEFAVAYGSADIIRPDYESIMQSEFVQKQNPTRLSQVQGMMSGSSRLDVSKAYIASYLAVRCMADFYGEQSLDTVLSSLGQGKSIDESMVEATGKNMIDFQDEFEHWLRNL